VAIHDEDIMTTALNEYALTSSGTFNLIEAWKILRESTKWHQVEPFEARKRSKSSSTDPRAQPSQSTSDARIVLASVPIVL
jgi:hypothetical protein